MEAGDITRQGWEKKRSQLLASAGRKPQTDLMENFPSPPPPIASISNSYKEKPFNNISNSASLKSLDGSDSDSNSPIPKKKERATLRMRKETSRQLVAEAAEIFRGSNGDLSTKSQSLNALANDMEGIRVGLGKSRSLAGSQAQSVDQELSQVDHSDSDDEADPNKDSSIDQPSVEAVLRSAEVMGGNQSNKKRQISKIFLNDRSLSVDPDFLAVPNRHRSLSPASSDADGPNELNSQELSINVYEPEPGTPLSQSPFVSSNDLGKLAIEEMPKVKLDSSSNLQKLASVNLLKQKEARGSLGNSKKPSMSFNDLMRSNYSLGEDIAASDRSNFGSTDSNLSELSKDTQAAKAQKTPKKVLDKFGTVTKRLNNLIQLGMQKSSLPDMIVTTSPEAVGRSSVSKRIHPGRVLDIKFENEGLSSSLLSLASITDVLRSRTHKSPKNHVYVALDSKGKEVSNLTFEKLLGRAEKIASLFIEKDHAKRGDKILLLFGKNEICDFIVSFFGCLFAGMIPVPFAVSPFENMVDEMDLIVSNCNIKVILSTDSQIKNVRKDLSYKAKPGFNSIEFWKVNDLGMYNSKKMGVYDYIPPSKDEMAYVEYSKSSLGEITALELSHESIMEQCKYSKYFYGFSSNDVLFSHKDARKASGLVNGIFLSVYSGCRFVNICGTNGPALFASTFCAGLLKKIKPTVMLIDHTAYKFLTQTKDLSSLFESMNTARLIIVDNYGTTTRPRIADNSNFGNMKVSQVTSLHDFGSIRITNIYDEKPPIEVSVSLESLAVNKVSIGKEGRALQADPGYIVLADSGWVSPNTDMCIVNRDGNTICKDKEIGEIYLKNDIYPERFLFKTFSPHRHVYQRISDVGNFFPSGCIGFTYGDRLFLLGSIDDMITQTNKDGSSSYYFATDVNQLIKQRFSNALRSCAFSIVLGDQELPAIIVEVVSKLSSQELQNMANFIKETLKTDLKLRAYAILLCPEGTLPRDYDGAVYISQVRKLFDSGLLNPYHVLFNVKESVNDIISTSERPHNIPNLNRLSALASDREMLQIADGNNVGAAGHGLGGFDKQNNQDLLQFDSLLRIVLWRSVKRPNDMALISLDGRGKEMKTVTFKKFNHKILKIATFLTKKGLKMGDTVALVFSNSLDYIYSFYACFYLGVTVVPLQPPDTHDASEQLNVLAYVSNKFNIHHILTNERSEDLLKHKSVAAEWKKIKRLSDVAIINVTKAAKQDEAYLENEKFDEVMRFMTAETNRYAVIQVYVSPDRDISLTYATHDTLIAQCAIFKETCNMIPSRPIFSWSKPYTGVGLFYCVALGPFVGCPTVVISAAHVLSSSRILVDILSKYKVKDAYAPKHLLDLIFSANHSADSKEALLSNLRSIMVYFDSRPLIIKRNKALHDRFRLDPDAVSCTFSTMAHSLLSSRCYLADDATVLALDLASLRNGLIKVVERNSLGSIRLQDSGRVSTCAYVAVVRPGTDKLCLFNEFGEIWVSSPGLVDKFDEETATMQVDGLDVGGFMNTKTYGFLYKSTINSYQDGETKRVQGELLFVLGTQSELIALEHGDRKYYFFQTDIENTVERVHPNILGAVAFISSFAGGLVLLIELLDPESDANNCLPVIVNAVIDDHCISPHMVIFLKENEIPRSRNGDKQRKIAQKMFEENQFSKSLLFSIN